MFCHFDKIPQKLADTRFWIFWHRNYDNGKIKKVPDEFVRLHREGRKVSWDDVNYKDLKTLKQIMLFDRACNAEGVGIAFRPNNDLAGIDIDGAINKDGSYNLPVRNKILPILAQARKDGCYIEKSYSDTGYHIYGYTTTAIKSRLYVVNNGSGVINAKGTHNVEIHYANTYFAVTGKALSGSWGCLDNTIKLAYEIIKGKPLFEKIPPEVLETPQAHPDNNTGVTVPPTVKPPEIKTETAKNASDGEFTDADVLALPGMDIKDVINIMSRDHTKHGAAAYKALKDGYPDGVNKSDYDEKILGTLVYWLYRFGEEEICRIFSESALYRSPDTTAKGKNYLSYTVHKLCRPDNVDIFFAAAKWDKLTDDEKAKLKRWMDRKSAAAREKAKHKK